MPKKRIQWFAAGGNIARCGPFESQVEAWASMRHTAEVREKTRLEHPRDTRVWPEEAT
jgi:hypothetical protein